MSRVVGLRCASAAWALAGAWVAAWGWLVDRSRGALWIDERVSSVLAVGKATQDKAILLLRVEGVAPAAVATLALAAVALFLRAPRAALAVVVGVALEIATVQWLIKPIVDRHEVAPDPAFPSSHVGAVVAVLAATLLLIDRLAPASGRSELAGHRALRAVVASLGTVDVAVVAAATIATGGHLFSDVAAVIPWGLTVPWIAFATLAPRPPSSAIAFSEAPETPRDLRRTPPIRSGPGVPVVDGRAHQHTGDEGTTG